MTSAEISRIIRRQALEVAHRAGLGHPGGDLSCADILAVLFAEVLQFEIQDPEWPGRDRFILSKGHASIAYYSALAAVGLLEPGKLNSFGLFGSHLSGHPAVTKLAVVEASTGPLGHGLPVGVGMALGSVLGSKIVSIVTSLRVMASFRKAATGRLPCLPHIVGWIILS